MYSYVYSHGFMLKTISTNVKGFITNTFKYIHMISFEDFSRIFLLESRNLKFVSRKAQLLHLVIIKVHDILFYSVIFTKYRLIPTKDMQTLHLPSVLIPFLWKVRNVLKRMKRQNSDFYFSNYREKCIKNWGDDVTKWPQLEKKFPDPGSLLVGREAPHQKAARI